jgi:hypothetical protein
MIATPDGGLTPAMSPGLDEGGGFDVLSGDYKAVRRAFDLFI